MKFNMKNALILHGAGNYSQGNWFPWLKLELEKKEYRVWSPDLPNSKEPNQSDWLSTIFSNKSWQFSNDSLIIGHSAGATLILRILEKLSASVKIKTAILVSGVVELGTKPEFFKYKRSLVRNPFKWKKIRSSCENFYFIHSDNDPYECGQVQGKIMQSHLGGNFIVKKGEGHFNLDISNKYNKFPELLKLS